MPSRKRSLSSSSESSSDSSSDSESGSESGSESSSSSSSQASVVDAREFILSEAAEKKPKKRPAKKVKKDKKPEKAAKKEKPEKKTSKSSKPKKDKSRKEKSSRKDEVKKDETPKKETSKKDVKNPSQAPGDDPKPGTSKQTSAKGGHSVQKPSVVKDEKIVRYDPANSLPTITIILTNREAKVPRKYTNDAAYDLFSDSDYTLRKFTTGKISTGIIVCFPPGIHGVLKSRSGLAEKMITVEGGVIDNSYVGYLYVLLKNMSGQNYEVKKHDRIAQLLVYREPCIAFKRVEWLDQPNPPNSEEVRQLLTAAVPFLPILPGKRMHAGFGSTGR